jgi:hypothetical protein
MSNLSASTGMKLLGTKWRARSNAPSTMVVFVSSSEVEIEEEVTDLIYFLKFIIHKINFKIIKYRIVVLNMK